MKFFMQIIICQKEEILKDEILLTIALKKISEL